MKFSSARRVRLFFLFLSVFSVVFNSFALPPGVTFTEIARSNVANGEATFIWPALNESGLICFRAASESRSAILKGDGAQVQTVAASDDGTGRFEKFTGLCSINDVGDVAFDACKNCSPTVLTQREYKIGVLRAGSSVASVIASTGSGPDDFSEVGVPTVNNNSQGVLADVSFNGKLNNGQSGIFIFRLGSIIPSSFNSTGFFSELGSAYMNDNNAFTFGGTESASPNARGIYGPSGNAVLTSTNPADKFSLPVINNSGTIAALTTGSQNGVFINGAPYILNNTGDFITVDASGAFQGISINDAGEIVFPAIRPNGGSVAFLAIPGGMAPLIEKGDFLPGYASPVSFVSTGREAINNTRQVSLVVGLEDKSQLVLRLDTANAVFPQDKCPEDNTKFEPGICGCGVSDLDTNRDGIANCVVTQTAKDLATQLQKNLGKLKKLPSNANKAKKQALKALVKDTTAISNQLFNLVKGSSFYVNLTSSKKSPSTLVTTIKNQVRTAVKTDNRDFIKNRKKAVTSIKSFIKLLKL